MGLCYFTLDDDARGIDIDSWDSSSQHDEFKKMKS